MSIFQASTLTVSPARAPFVPPSHPNDNPNVFTAVASGGYGTNFNSTFVSMTEAQQIAYWVAFCLVTGSTATFTAPLSGVTVVGNGPSGVTVDGTSLTPTQAQQFVQQVGNYAVDYE